MNLQELRDKIYPPLEETDNKRVINRLHCEIIQYASEYLSDENVIGLYVECNAPLRPKSHDAIGSSLHKQKKPYVNLVAVFDEQDPKYKSLGDTITITSISGESYGNYDFITYYSSIDNYSWDNRLKTGVSYVTSIGLIRGIIMYDKYGILTEAQQELPKVLHNMVIDIYGGIQDNKINKTLSKKLPIIGVKK